MISTVKLERCFCTQSHFFNLNFTSAKPHFSNAPMWVPDQGNFRKPLSFRLKDLFCLDGAREKGEELQWPHSGDTVITMFGLISLS